MSINRREPNEFETYLFFCFNGRHWLQELKYYLKKLNSSFEVKNAGYVEIGDNAIYLRLKVIIIKCSRANQGAAQVWGNCKRYFSYGSKTSCFT